VAHAEAVVAERVWAAVAVVEDIAVVAVRDVLRQCRGRRWAAVVARGRIFLAVAVAHDLVVEVAVRVRILRVAVPAARDRVAVANSIDRKGIDSRWEICRRPIDRVAVSVGRAVARAAAVRVRILRAVALAERGPVLVARDLAAAGLRRVS